MCTERCDKQSNWQSQWPLIKKQSTDDEEKEGNRRLFLLFNDDDVDDDDGSSAGRNEDQLRPLLGNMSSLPSLIRTVMNSLQNQKSGQRQKPTSADPANRQTGRRRRRARAPANKSVNNGGKFNSTDHVI